MVLPAALIVVACSLGTGAGVERAEAARCHKPAHSTTVAKNDKGIVFRKASRKSRFGLYKFFYGCSYTIGETVKLKYRCIVNTRLGEKIGRCAITEDEGGFPMDSSFRIGSREVVVRISFEDLACGKASLYVYRASMRTGYGRQTRRNDCDS